MDDAKVGSVFRAVRIRRDMSQSQVAEAAGISRAVVSSIERGLLEGTSMRLVRRVSTALGISLGLEAGGAEPRRQHSSMRGTPDWFGRLLRG